LTLQNMLDRGHTLRFNALSFLQELASHGLGLTSRHNAKISGLGVKLASLTSGDPALAQEISKGKFSFAGTTVMGLPPNLFDLPPPNPEWLASLHGLTWLNHFVASGQELQRIVARLLVEKWGGRHAVKFNSTVHSNALIALSLSAHFLVDTSSTFKAPFFAIVERKIRRVAALRPATITDRLLQIISLQYASLAFRTPLPLRDDANARFCEVINQVILPDGGHVSRSPRQLLETLLIIIPLRDAMLAHHQVVPQPLSAAIERMVPMLRMLSHGDQGLGLFQGTGATRLGAVKSILERDKVHGRPLLLAPHSGYCRLAHRTAALLVDVGVPAICNSSLALEFSDGQHRIFSNCGMPLAASTAWQTAAAGIAAHNTLEVNGFAFGAKHAPQAEVINSPRGSLARCQNHLSGKAGRITHERNLFLSQDGRDLRGEDKLSSTTHGFTIRFHLHPTVKATSIRNGSKIVLVLPNRAAWNFSARGGIVSLEESVFLGDANGPRKTAQIVIRSGAENQSPVKWALRRMEKSAASETDREDAPQLPF
jgi:uncharacterized heparinase superfamily protein